MNLPQPSMHPCVSSTPAVPPVEPRYAVSCVERLELLGQASTDQRLQARSLAVLVQLAQYVNSKAGMAWPTQQRLGSALGMVRQHVYRALNELEACGYLIRTTARPEAGMGPRLAYRLTYPQAVTTHDYTEAETGESVTTQGYTPVTTQGYRLLPPVVTPLNPVIEPGNGNPGNGTPTGFRERGTPGIREISKPQPPPAPAPPPGYLPEDWHPSEKAIVNAMRELDLTRGQVEVETQRFTARCRSRGDRSCSWLDEWWRWLDHLRPGSPLRERVLGVKPNGAVTSNIGNPGRIEDLAAWGVKEWRP